MRLFSITPSRFMQGISSTLFAYFFSLSSSESGGPLIPASRPAIHLTVFGFRGFCTREGERDGANEENEKKSDDQN